MVYGPLQIWHSWTDKTRDLQRDYLYGVRDGRMHLKSNTLIKPPKLVTHFLQHESLLPSGVMVHRNVLEEVGGSEEVFRGNYEDDAVQVKICLRFTVFASSECWYRYRQHPNSTCRVIDRLGLSNTTRLFFLNWVEEYLFEQGIRDLEVWRALRQAVWHCKHYKLSQFLSAGYYVAQIEKLAIHIGIIVLPASMRHRMWRRWQTLRRLTTG